MNQRILFVSTLLFCFALCSDIGAQQRKKKVSAQTQKLTVNKPQQKGQGSEPRFSMATITFLDGSTQQWGDLRFVYEQESAPRHSSPCFTYLASSQGNFSFWDRVGADTGGRIEALYSEKSEFLHVVLTIRRQEPRVLGTSQKHGPPFIVARDIIIKGICSVGGQSKECSAYLIPGGQSLGNKGNLVKEIVFIDPESSRAQQTTLLKNLPPTTPAEILLAVKALNSCDVEKRADAADELGRMGATALPAIPFLVYLLSDGEKTRLEFEFGRLRSWTTPGSRAAYALARIGKPGLDALITVLKDPEKNLADRENSAYALGDAMYTDAVEPLINALKEKDEDLRSAAKQSLKKIAGQDFGVDPAKWEEWWAQNKQRKP